MFARYTIVSLLVFCEFSPVYSVKVCGHAAETSSDHDARTAAASGLSRFCRRESRVMQRRRLETNYTIHQPCSPGLTESLASPSSGAWPVLQDRCLIRHTDSELGLVALT